VARRYPRRSVRPELSIIPGFWGIPKDSRGSLDSRCRIGSGIDCHRYCCWRPSSDCGAVGVCFVGTRRCDHCADRSPDRCAYSHTSSSDSDSDAAADSDACNPATGSTADSAACACTSKPRRIPILTLQLPALLRSALTGPGASAPTVLNNLVGKRQRSACSGRSAKHRPATGLLLDSHEGNPLSGGVRPNT
jgi:hypothetical protein